MKKKLYLNYLYIFYKIQLPIEEIFYYNDEKDADDNENEEDYDILLTRTLYNMTTFVAATTMYVDIVPTIRTMSVFL